jgi:hypothetical protein
VASGDIKSYKISSKCVERFSCLKKLTERRTDMATPIYAHFMHNVKRTRKEFGVYVFFNYVKCDFFPVHANLVAGQLKCI